MNRLIFVAACFGFAASLQGFPRARNCLADKDCDKDECCAQAFYLFRCEKRGFVNGDRCGLCGCKNGLSCVSEGINPFKVLSGRGHCRYQSQEVAPSPVSLPVTLPVVRPQPQPQPPKPVDSTEEEASDRHDSGPAAGSLRPDIIKPPTKPIAAVKPGKDHFYETFRPIYEQFIEAAASVAGIDINETINNPTS